MRRNATKKQQKQRFFAVTSVGKGRWYWVVWPSLESIRVEGETGHIADGYAPEKAEAIDEALVLAGIDGEWVAGKYAKDYHRQRHGKNKAQAPVMIEFLYQDKKDEVSKDWFSVPHRIIKKTPKFVFVEQHVYDANTVTGSWLDYDAPTYRLNRQLLEEDGYTLAPIGDIEDPLFFATPYQDRLTAAPACFNKLNLNFPATTAQVKRAYRDLVKQVHPDQGGNHDDFLSLQAAYEQALRLSSD
ncbi:MAG: J domain-containing protein [Chloroflexota bacterium]